MSVERSLERRWLDGPPTRLGSAPTPPSYVRGVQYKIFEADLVWLIKASAARTRGAGVAKGTNMRTASRVHHILATEAQGIWKEESASLMLISVAGGSE